MELLKHYQQIVIQALEDFYAGYEPKVESLYQPVKYALEGGKKIRPICTLLTAECYGADLATVLPGALAIEMFHNFTLVHDDVMDRSPLRRGKPTVFHKWDINQAILSGDAMLLLVYQLISRLPQDLIKPATVLMTWAGLRVSEGQQLDMEFESLKQISLQQYMEMIELKTAVLLGTSFKMGAMLAKAPTDEQQNLFEFGRQLGLAFQIQDDLFDLYADEQKFGKKLGNDIITHKKTFLLVKALELANPQQKQMLIDLYFNDSIAPQERIQAVKQIYEQLNIPKHAQQLIDSFYLQSKQSLEKLTLLSAECKEKIWSIAQYLMKRQK